LVDYAIESQSVTIKGCINLHFSGRQWKIIVIRAQHFSDFFFPFLELFKFYMV